MRRTSSPHAASHRHTDGIAKPELACREQERQGRQQRRKVTWRSIRLRIVTLRRRTIRVQTRTERRLHAAGPMLADHCPSPIYRSRATLLSSKHALAKSRLNGSLRHHRLNCPAAIAIELEASLSLVVDPLKIVANHVIVIRCTLDF